MRDTSEFDDITLQVSLLSMNYGSVQQPPDNACYDNTPLSTFDINAFAEDIVEAGMISKFGHANKSRTVHLGAMHSDNPRGITAES